MSSAVSSLPAASPTSSSTSSAATEALAEGQVAEGQAEVPTLPHPAPQGTLRTELDARLREFGATGRGTLVLTMPAPEAAAEAFLDLATLPEAFFWQGPDGAAHAGQGAVHSLHAAGPERFKALRQLAERALDRVVSEAVGSGPVVEPRLWGGLAFDEGAASEAPWSSFGDAQFFLPRFLYRHRPRNGSTNGTPAATLSLAATAEEARDETVRSSLLDQLQEMQERLRSEGNASASILPPRNGEAETEADDGSWIRHVEDIRRAIASGDVEKIVAARRFRVAVDPDLATSAVLQRLGRGLRSSIRFAFRRHTEAGKVTFLGATPERLVSKCGNRLETEALAGTMEAGGEHAAELLESGKNRHEQQLVTDSIVRRLRPLCTDLEVADRPTVRELRDILHLHTPIRGELKEEHHVLDLVEALHPTPAVGGVPTPEAMSWIAKHEIHPRGWYAAPIGWIDARGDGEFYVALRSCVVAGGEAFLYAGAGIVGDSDPLAELRETELKTHALRGALRS